jgi:hypothetical protein
MHTPQPQPQPPAAAAAAAGAHLAAERLHAARQAAHDGEAADVEERAGQHRARQVHRAVQVAHEGRADDLERPAEEGLRKERAGQGAQPAGGAGGGAGGGGGRRWSGGAGAGAQPAQPAAAAAGRWCRARRAPPELPLEPWALLRRRWRAIARRSFALRLDGRVAPLPTDLGPVQEGGEAARLVVLAAPFSLHVEGGRPPRALRRHRAPRPPPCTGS